MIYHSTSVEETEKIASDFARFLRGGECIALYGNLGAGKTQFVRGLAVALGNDPRAVSSPTFVLLNLYDKGRLKIFHFDAYRISGALDFEAIGFTEFQEQNGVVVVEWADRIEKLLPAQRIDIHIATIGPDGRTIEIAFPIAH